MFVFLKTQHRPRSSRKRLALHIVLTRLASILGNPRFSWKSTVSSENRYISTGRRRGRRQRHEQRRKQQRRGHQRQQPHQLREHGRGCVCPGGDGGGGAAAASAAGGRRFPLVGAHPRRPAATRSPGNTASLEKAPAGHQLQQRRRRRCGR